MSRVNGSTCYSQLFLSLPFASPRLGRCLVRDSLKPSRAYGEQAVILVRHRSASSRATSHSQSRTAPPNSAKLQNLLLAALPDADRASLLPLFDIVPMTLKDLLHKPGRPIDYVYFPGGGFCSIVAVLKNGSMVEVATVGREGVVGATEVLDGHAGSSATIVQGASDICYRMTAQAYRREMDRRGPFYELVTHFVQAFVGMIMQSTACNAVHKVEQRLARWLLMAHDRMGSDEFPLTQEFAAMMLGATRPTVTVVAGLLQKAGLITYHRGRVAIVDRDRLEAASCECYAVTTRLLQADAPAVPIGRARDNR
jgi:CRP-like cAMP-binding protein